jgi:hypothetical protein
MSAPVPLDMGTLNFQLIPRLYDIRLGGRKIRLSINTWRMFYPPVCWYTALNIHIAVDKSKCCCCARNLLKAERRAV